MNNQENSIQEDSNPQLPILEKNIDLQGEIQNPPTEENPTVDKANSHLNDHQENTRWKDGDDITLVRVRFPGNAKSFPFLQGNRNFLYGQKVVAMSDRGLDVGYINSFPYTVKFNKSMLPVRSISKVATDEDIIEMQGNFQKQKDAENMAVGFIHDLKLDMQITHVEIIQYGKKMVFYFTAPSRVDFRELVKRLVGKLKMRIELRQISVRDRTAALGSIGACGQATCCSTFLKNYGNVSIKMAKNQNLALIPAKINGVCGQIKCCIKYEDDVYSEKRNLLPREGTFLKTENGDKGKVTKLHLIIEQFDMITDKGQIRRYARGQFIHKNILGKDYRFPDSFQHVVNETNQVIGLEEDSMDLNNSSVPIGRDEEKASQANVEALKEFDEKTKANIPSDEKEEETEATKRGKGRAHRSRRSRNSNNSNDGNKKPGHRGRRNRNRNKQKGS